MKATEKITLLAELKAKHEANLGKGIGKLDLATHHKLIAEYQVLFGEYVSTIGDVVSLMARSAALAQMRAMGIEIR